MSARQAVMVAPVDDEHGEAVAEALRPKTELIRFDAEALAAGAFHLEDGQIELAARQLAPSGGPPIRGWIRRYAPPGWRHRLALDSHDGVVRTAWIALLAGIVRTLPVDWLSEPGALTFADGKLEQLAVARSIGVRVPRTAVVSDPRRVPGELGDRFVVKPLGPADYVDDQEQPRVVFAGSLDRADPRLADLSSAPFLLQTVIHAAQHLRVVVVDDRTWACGIEAAGRPLDWRAQDEAHGAFETLVGFEEIRAQASALCAQLRIGYASQDWIIDSDGAAWFLDLNPGGQWLFLPEPTASEISAKMAAWLERG